MRQSMRLHRVGHDLVTEEQQKEWLPQKRWKITIIGRDMENSSSSYVAGGMLNCAVTWETAWQLLSQANNSHETQQLCLRRSKHCMCGHSSIYNSSEVGTTQNTHQQMTGYSKGSMFKQKNIFSHKNEVLIHRLHCG